MFIIRDDTPKEISKSCHPTEVSFNSPNMLLNFCDRVLHDYNHQQQKSGRRFRVFHQDVQSTRLVLLLVIMQIYYNQLLNMDMECMNLLREFLARSQNVLVCCALLNFLKLEKTMIEQKVACCSGDQNLCSPVFRPKSCTRIFSKLVFLFFR